MLDPEACSIFIQSVQTSCLKQLVEVLRGEKSAVWGFGFASEPSAALNPNPKP